MIKKVDLHQEQQKRQKKSQNRSKNTLATVTLTKKTGTLNGLSQKEQKHSSLTLETISDCRNTPTAKGILQQNMECMTIQSYTDPIKEIKDTSQIQKNVQAKKNNSEFEAKRAVSGAEIEKVKSSDSDRQNTLKIDSTAFPKEKGIVSHNSEGKRKTNCSSEQDYIRPDSALPAEEKKSREKRKKKKRIKYISQLEPNGYSQELVKEIKDIVGGMIVTNRNRYIYIMEIFPVNFHEKPAEVQASILNNFKRFPKIAPANGQLKVITEQTDMNIIINRIMEACPASRGDNMLRIRNDYIQNIKAISNANTINYRYFYIFEYEGNTQGYKSNQVNDIYRSMMLTKSSLKEILLTSHNMVAEPENPVLHTMEILYQLLNRHTYLNERLLARIMRINYDCRQKDVKPEIGDYIAPKGVVFDNKECVLMDGLYYTWFTLEDISYPDRIQPDWINQFLCTTNMDIDFYMKRLPHESTKKRLAKKTAWSRVSLKGTNNNNKAEELVSKINNTSYIVRKMEEGDDLFDCCTVCTLYDTDMENLFFTRDKIQKSFNSIGMKIEPCYMDCREYFFMTLPLVKFENTIFKRNKRNFTASALKNLYCFTGYTLYDQSEYSVVIGPNLKNGTLAAVNKFNTSLYPNPHVTIIGTSGAGKSFLEMALGRRDVIMGVKTHYILPTKAHEYLDACRELNGTYCSFTQDSQDIYNMMELYPEMTMTVEENTGKKTEKSVLSKKITSLCTWIRILSLKETSNKYQLSNMDINRINSLLMKLYEKYTFTKDNDSIWLNKSKKIKKRMPVIGDWYEQMKADENLNVYADLLLPFVTGSFKNFNQQSNIDFQRDCIIYDVEVDDIGEDLHPAIMYMAFDCATNQIKSDLDHFQSLYLDEVWRMMVDDLIGKQVEEQIRLLRGYGGSVVCASQDIAEFTNNKYGQAVISNSSINIILKLKESEVKIVSKYISLDQSDKDFITTAKQGQMIILCNGSKTRCALKASLDECIAYNTDLNKKKEYQKLKKETEKPSGINTV